MKNNKNLYIWQAKFGITQEFQSLPIVMMKISYISNDPDEASAEGEEVGAGVEVSLRPLMMGWTTHRVMFTLKNQKKIVWNQFDIKIKSKKFCRDSA